MTAFDKQVSFILEGLSGDNRIAFDQEEQSFVVSQPGLLYWKNLNKDRSIEKDHVFEKVEEFFKSDKLCLEDKRLFGRAAERRVKALQGRLQSWWYWPCMTKNKRDKIEVVIKRIQSLEEAVFPKTAAPPPPLTPLPHTSGTPASDNHKYLPAVRGTPKTKQWGKTAPTPDRPSTIVRDGRTRPRSKLAEGSTLAQQLKFRTKDEALPDDAEDSVATSSASASQTATSSSENAPILPPTEGAAGQPPPPPAMPGKTSRVGLAPPMKGITKKKEEKKLEGEKTPSDPCQVYDKTKIQKLSENDLNAQISELEECSKILRGLLDKAEFPKKAADIQKIKENIVRENDPEIEGSLGQLRVRERNLEQKLEQLAANPDAEQRFKEPRKKSEDLQILYLPDAMINECIEKYKLSRADKEQLEQLRATGLQKDTREEYNELPGKLKSAKIKLANLQSDLDALVGKTSYGISSDDFSSIQNKKMSLLSTWRSRISQRKTQLEKLKHPQPANSSAVSDDSNSLPPLIAEALRLAKHPTLQVAFKQGTKNVAKKIVVL